MRYSTYRGKFINALYILWDEDYTITSRVLLISQHIMLCEKGCKYLSLS